MHNVTFYPLSLHQMFSYFQECSQHTDTWNNNNYKRSAWDQKEPKCSMINCPTSKQPTVCQFSSSAGPRESVLPSWHHPPPELWIQLDSGLETSVKDRNRNTNIFHIAVIWPTFELLNSMTNVTCSVYQSPMSPLSNIYVFLIKYNAEKDAIIK